MADRVLQSHNDTDKTTRKSMRPHQSAWVAHWMRPSSTQAHGHLSLNCEVKEDAGEAKKRLLLDGPQMGNSASTFAKGFREVSAAKGVDIMDETLKKHTRKSGIGKLDIQPCTVFNVSQCRDSNMALGNDQAIMCDVKTWKPQFDLNYGYDTATRSKNETQFPMMLEQLRPETSSREWCFKPEGVSCNPEQQLEYHKFREKSNLSVSTSFKDDVGSSSKIVPYKFNSGRAPMQLLMSRQEEINRSSVFTSKEHLTGRCYSTIFIREKRTDNPLDSRAGTSLLGQNDVTQPLHSFASDYQLPFLFSNQSAKMQSCPGSRLFPIQSIPLEMNKSEKLYPDCYSLPRMPSSVNDVETMRMCTTDSVPELSGGSERAHHFLLTEKTDVNLSKGGQLLRESTVSMKLKGKMFSEFLPSAPAFGFLCQQGVKLQPIGSSTESEGNDRDVKTSAACIRNESSAETDTLDMDIYQKNNPSGVALSSSNKDINGEQFLSKYQAAAASARDVGSRVLNAELPEINQELPALPARASSVDDRETSTSRTQSLDVECLLSDAEQPTNSKSGACPGGHFKPDPGSRWVKRLKISASDSFGHGTKSSKMGEASSNETRRIVKCSVTSSEPTNVKYNGKAPSVLDRTASLVRTSMTSSSGLVGLSPDITLLHPWIRRWSSNKVASPPKKSEAVLEPPKSKGTLGEFQKQHFPSIAAMALMGKAMSGFNPCELRKSGSLVVWNSNRI